MRHRAEFCQKNLKRGSALALQKLEQSERGVRIDKYSCIDHCQLCARRPFVLMDGKHLVEGEDGESLCQAVDHYLQHPLSKHPFWKRGGSTHSP